MITLIGPEDGGIAHVARSLADRWSTLEPVNLLLVGSDGTVTNATCHCTPARVRNRRSVAGQAVRSAWAHRACLRASRSFHLELGRISLSALWFALAACLFTPRTPLITSTHDVPSVVLHPAAALMRRAPGWRDAVAYRLLARLADRPVLALLRRRTAATVVLSSAARSAAEAAGWPEVHQVSHGAAEPTADAPSPADARYILLAGYLGPGKGLDVLARAWVQAETDLPLVIAGGYSDQHAAWVEAIRTDLDRLPRPPRWLGFLDDDGFAEAIANSAIVVIPYEEANPVSGVLIRALVEGRAVIGTRLSAVTDEIVDGVSGLIVEPGDAAGLAAAITQLSARPGRRRQLGTEAARVARARHSWSQHVQALSDLHAAVAVAAARAPAQDADLVGAGATAPRSPSTRPEGFDNG